MRCIRLSMSEFTVQSLTGIFPEPWPERLAVIRYSDAKLDELKSRYESNWYHQTTQSMGFSEAIHDKVIQLAEQVWTDPLARHYSLISRHFLFHAADSELDAFTWSTDCLANAEFEDKALFFVMIYLSAVDLGIQVYREQRIPLDLYHATAAWVFSSFFERTVSMEESHQRLAWLCQGKISRLGHLVYLPGRWDGLHAVWRNGISGELRDIQLSVASSGLDNLIQDARTEGLDLNLWQLKLKPNDRVLQVIDQETELSEADWYYSLEQANRFYKDSLHYHNFVAYDFSSCPVRQHSEDRQLVLREELG